MNFLQRHPSILAVIIVLFVLAITRLIFESELEAVAYSALFVAILAYMSVLETRVLMARRDATEQASRKGPEGGENQNRDHDQEKG